MITMANFGKNGRLGNQLFQLASLAGLANKHKRKLKLPDWQYSDVFKNYNNYADTDKLEINKYFQINEVKPGYTISDNEFVKKIAIYNINGYLQSYKYFENININHLLEFDEKFVEAVRFKYDIANVFKRETIAIHIRRGDYVDNPNYYQLPIKYYITALLSIDDWREHNIIVFSDDIEYCKVHFQCLDNVYFAEGNEIQDLCLMAQCNKFILSNSSFSWWGAMLSLNRTLVLRPSFHFAGALNKTNFNLGEYYPADWYGFNHLGRQIDLEDTTFVIPVRYDHKDRKENFDLSVEMIKKNFDTFISVGEQGNNKFEYCRRYLKYIKFSNMTEFHRTKMLNELIKKAETKIVVNWDCDVFIPPLQLYLAIEKIRNGADVVYPYEGRFRRMPRPYYFDLDKYKDIGIVGDNKFDNDKAISVGGAIAFKRESFLNAGGENEKFISFGAEDTERFVRFKTLGYKVKRVKGALYHLNHFVGVDSSTKNPYFLQNRDEFNKVYNLDKQDLTEYINKEFTWKTK